VPRNANVISCLQYIAANPVTADGKRTTPVVWDSACLEEVCGACTMIISGRVRQACSALLRALQQRGILSPRDPVAPSDREPPPAHAADASQSLPPP